MIEAELFQPISPIPQVHRADMGKPQALIEPDSGYAFLIHMPASPICRVFQGKPHHLSAGSPAEKIGVYRQGI